MGLANDAARLRTASVRQDQRQYLAAGCSHHHTSIADCTLPDPGYMGSTTRVPGTARCQYSTGVEIAGSTYRRAGYPRVRSARSILGANFGDIWHWNTR